MAKRDPVSGMTAVQMERDESEWRKANADTEGNTLAAVQDDARYIAERTGADVDKVQVALIKRFKPHEDDGDSITRRDADLDDDEFGALMADLYGDE